MSFIQVDRNEIAQKIWDKIYSKSSNFTINTHIEGYKAVLIGSKCGVDYNPDDESFSYQIYKGKKLLAHVTNFSFPSDCMSKMIDTTINIANAQVESMLLLSSDLSTSRASRKVPSKST